MNKVVKVNGVLRIKNPLDDLAPEEKSKVIDQILAGNSGRYLNVDFTFSHSGKRINRRIYSRKGQKRVADTLADKALNLDHGDSVKDIIGRISKASYVDLTAEAKTFAKKARIKEDRIDELNDALETLDYQKIADIYHGTKLLQLRGWKGVGKVEATARVTDSDSIIKFLDRRYLNFSAEQSPSQYICSICLKDSYQDSCEHFAGQTYDGKLAFMICGDMEGAGAGVVMTGADPDALVRSLSLTDSEDDDDQVLNDLESKSIVDARAWIESDESTETKIFTLGGVIEELEHMEVKDETTTDVVQAETTITEDITEVAALVDVSIELNKTIDSLRSEVSIKDSEIKTLTDKLTDLSNSLDQVKAVSTTAVDSFRKNHGRVLALAKSLEEKENKILDSMKPLLTILGLEIKDGLSLDSVPNLLNTVDREKIENFMKSGLTRIVEDIVESPVINLPEKTLSNEYHDNVRAKYQIKLKEHGKSVADSYIKNLISNKYVPKDFQI